MSESAKKQTHTTGDVYIHPRGREYRGEFCRIFGHRPFCGCEDVEDVSESQTEPCNKGCEGCDCHGKNS